MSIEMIDIMLPAFAECLVLVGIHSYLGIHVIKRKVIFVDLALAQIAALGTTFAFLFGIDPTSTGAYWFSLCFTILGAAVFSLSRIRHEKVPQEAVIGLVYALAAALAILVVDRAPHGAEHIKEIMTGSILWVKWETIIIAAIVYSLVGVFHYIFRDKFMLISIQPEIAYQKGINVRLWDFLFYVSFGIVITHSVSTAGVLLVFVFLVVPAIATIMLTDKLWLQLILGWSMGTFVSIAGLYISYIADLPSGPTVVSTYGLVLLVTTLLLYIFRAKQKRKALLNVGLGIAIFFVVVSFFWFMGQGFASVEHHKNQAEATSHANGDEHESGLHKFEQLNDEQLHEFLTVETSVKKLLDMYHQVQNPFQRFEIADKIFSLDQKTGSPILIEYLEESHIPFLKQKALDHLMSLSKKNFGYDALVSREVNQIATQKWRNWWSDKFNEHF
jgi:zinc/manganese transport system permease protein